MIVIETPTLSPDFRPFSEGVNGVKSTAAVSL
jgi:hypothetical protein